MARWYALLPLMALCSPRLLAPQASQALTGAVLDTSNNNLLDNVRVSLIDPRVEAVTGSDGIFVLSVGKKPGALVRLRATKEGYKAYEIDEPVSTKPIIIHLQRKAPPSPDDGARDQEERSKARPDPRAQLAISELVNRSRRSGPDDPVRALIYAVEAARQAEIVGTDNYEVEDALRGAMHGVIPERVIEEAANIVRFSPNGTRIVMVGNSVQVLDLHANSIIFSSGAHDGPVTNASFSPDGDSLLTCGVDGTARLQSLEALPTPPRVMDSHSGAIDACSFDHTGTRVLTAGRDKTARVWDTRTGKMIHELRGHSRALTLAVFSNNGARILTGDLSGNVGMWDASTGGQLWMKGEGFTPGRGGFSDNDEKFYLADLRGGSVAVCDTGTGEPLTPILNVKLPPVATSFDSSGEQLFVVPGGGSAQLWKIDAQPRILAELRPEPGGAGSGELAKSAGIIGTGYNDGIITLFRMSAPSEVILFPGHRGAITQTRFTRDGMHFMTAGADGTVKVWPSRPARGSLKIRSITPTCEYAVADIEEGLVAVADGSHMISILDDITAKRILDLPPATSRIVGLAVSRRRDILVSAESQYVRAWSLSTRRARWSKYAPGGINTGVVLSPNADRIASYTADRLAVWGSETGAELFRLTSDQISSTQAPIQDVAFSPDGGRIAIAVGSDSLVLDGRTGAINLRLPGRAGSIVQRVRFSHSGKKLGASSPLGDTTEIWDTASGARVQVLPHGGLDLSFSPNDSLVITTSADGTAALWNADTGERVSRFEGNRGPIVSGSFSPDGARVITAALDGTSRIWHPDTGQQISTLEFRRDGMRLAYYTADGHRIVTVGADRMAIYPARLRDLREAAETLLSAAASGGQHKLATAR